MIANELDLCVTNTCNFGCRYCYARGRNLSKTYISFSDMEKAVLLYLKTALSEKTEVNKISISGGEPLTLWKEISPFLDWYKKDFAGKIRGEIFTNAALLTPEKAAMITGSGIFLKISFDGRKKTQDMTRRFAGGGSTFKPVFENLAATGGLLGKMICVPVVSKKNAGLFFENMEFLCGLGFLEVQPSFVVEEKWDKEELKTLSKQLDKIALRRRSDPKFSSCLKPVNVKNLSGGLDKFTRDNEVSVGTDLFFYPSSLLSSSAPFMSEAARAKYRIGNLEEGLDTRKFARTRLEAYEKIISCGAKLYLGCVLCMYYASVVDGGNPEPAMLSGERISALLAEKGFCDLSA